MPDVKIVCPICKKELELKDNPFRPFCSERCKLIDLGTWASGEYKIEGRPEDEGGGRTQKEEQ